MGATRHGSFGQTLHCNFIMSVQILLDVATLLTLKKQASWLAQPFPPIKICAWCPSKARNELALKNAGLEISHGMCEGCFEVQQARVPIPTS